jgi:hypothetical protein
MLATMQQLRRLTLDGETRICVFVYLCICVFVYLCICVFVMFGKRIYSAHLGLGKWMANGQVGGSPRPGALAARAWLGAAPQI